MTNDERRNTARWVASVALHASGILPDNFDTSSYFRDLAGRRFYAEVVSRDICELLGLFSNFILDQGLSSEDLENIDDLAALVRVIEVRLAEKRDVESGKMSACLPFGVLPDDTWSAL